MKRQKSFENENPTLYLVATPIGNLDEITFRTINILKEVDYVAAEDTRNSIKILNHLNINKPLISHHEHNLQSSIPKIIDLLKEGNNIALVSDAGYPAISDPGAQLIEAAIKEEINIVSVSGPNALLNALVCSGIKPQPFLFYGFLDHKDKIKRKQLEDLKDYKETIIFYEAPHRINKTLTLMLEIFGERRMALCRELTKIHEEIIRGTISEILEIDDLKGEIVLVVEGNTHADEKKNYSKQEIVELVDHYIEKGMSTKDAIKEVASNIGENKNLIYKKYHE